MPNQTVISPELIPGSSECDVTSMDMRETELTLGPPGGSIREKSGSKRDGSPCRLDGSTRWEPPGNILADDEAAGSILSTDGDLLSISMAEAVGCPAIGSCKYVKVAADGAPYLRKVDLEMYSSYQQLFQALETMFSGCTLNHDLLGKGSMVDDPMKGSEFVPTFEDKDGDWMLVGDVPWQMFIESCKRIRLVKGSEPLPEH